jgi:uncharacterized cupredoxin-like copper-binding protein
MEFWRRGATRSARPSAAPQRQLGAWQRITGLHFPPWVPVAGIILVVFGILGGLFLIRSTAGAPRQGDHWHATYTFTACGEKQPNAPTWEGSSGVHTHGDGIMHIHPFQTYSEGSGARMVKWFEYGRGKLTNDSINMPGSTKTYKNGDKCPDGTEGELQVFVTTAATGVETRLSDVTRFQPHDGDRVRMVFGPREEEPVVADDRTIIPESQVTGEPITITVTDDGTDSGTKFEPNRISVKADEVVKLVIKNTGSISHGFRVIGADDVYETQDDFVVTPTGEDPETTSGLLQPGAEGVAIIRLESGGGDVEFRDDTLQDKTGTIVVSAAAVTTASPTPVPADQVDAEVIVTLKDDAFEPVELTVPAGKKFRISIKNEGTLACNLRIAGPDGDYRTDDDITSDTVNPGNTGGVVGQIDKAGAYAFRCDFRPELTGTVTVE